MTDGPEVRLTPQELHLWIVAGLQNPNIGRLVQVTLKNGPRIYRFATLYEIVNPATSSHHHWCLRIDTYERRKSGWNEKADRQLVIDNDGSTELQDLMKLVQTALGGQLAQSTGDYHVVDSGGIESIRTLLKLAKGANSEGRLRIVQSILSSLDVNAMPGADWVTVFGASKRAVNEIVGAAARLVEYTRARDQLAALINKPGEPEQSFQQVLKEHPWMFGSEYSDLLERRSWARDDRLDFMLRRTSDEYLEIVEIKTPLPTPLFRYDISRDSYGPGKDLSAGLGQVVRSIEEVERHRDNIKAVDSDDPLKIRARLVIGRDSDAGQQAALRNLNGHLHRIEVITFDQLLRIAGRVLSVFQAKLQPEQDLDETFSDFPENLDDDYGEG